MQKFLPYQIKLDNIADINANVGTLTQYYSVRFLNPRIHCNSLKLTSCSSSVQLSRIMAFCTIFLYVWYISYVRDDKFNFTYNVRLGFQSDPNIQTRLVVKQLIIQVLDSRLSTSHWEENRSFCPPITKEI